MMLSRLITFSFAALLINCAFADNDSIAQPDSIIKIDSIIKPDSITAKPKHHVSYTELTDSDYLYVANEINVEVAAIKAVIEIEAGKNLKGFLAPKKPVLYFSKNMFNKNLRKRGITVSAKQRKNEAAFLPLNRRKYGSYLGAQHARFESACTIDSVSAILSCYWGMFQIGGFNWKRCGCSSPQEFAEKMTESEFEQLELFVHFISNNNNLQHHLRNKNWVAFARIYNGSKRARSYANRMAAAYKRHAKQQSNSKPQTNSKQENHSKQQSNSTTTK